MNNSRGFSLSEMLVVITILAFVMVAVLAALNPLQQIRKAQDAARIKEATDLLKAYGGYFATYKCYPWDPDAPDRTGRDNSRLFTATVPNFSASGADFDLVKQGYLRESFISKKSIKNGKFLVSEDNERKLSVCYEPESIKSRRGNFLPLTDNINQAAIPGNTCTDVNGYPDGTCFICFGF